MEDVDDVEQSAPLLVAPFYLYGGRLFRFHLLRDARHYGLLIDYHHLIVDGTSMNLLLHDISAAYDGQALSPEAITLADIANQEETQRQTPAFEEARQWYARHFDCGDTFRPCCPTGRIP